ncbi:CCA tRNA nucleotidyltransferase [Halocatena pleomorpha]|uniref:CCA-adding enzyme n=1 Tax=Halocatena pleomorpha TaxID=1785090 RepID=A0A3P3RG58_9EURY|nr:CCA tRNA nucleotidyltransferase [Halocatena pleomorpha]RRJ32516.1 CCA tRNA nucleotidyltransferase [Halocatena pleomorpha]
MGDAFDAVTDRARSRVDPDPTERERLGAVAETLIARAETAVEELPVSADVLQVGSTARNTWTSGNRDIDVFVRFPPKLSREQLERYGLRVGWEVLPDGREEFAEHPYVTGERSGFGVDIVPCFAVESAGAIQSAVDRTPFHTEYVATRLDSETAGAVRLAKGFLRGIGAYGSDLRTRGFSGYLTELLVLEYGCFRSLIESVAEWKLPVTIDPEGHGERSFDAPLVVIDPTDPERNVAAVCSERNVARLIHHARAFQDDPTVDRFVPDDPEPLSQEAMRAQLSDRETTPVAVRFDAPDLVDDQLYPQLDRSLRGLRDELDRRGFDPLRATTVANDHAVLFVECEVPARPAVERHVGPPVDAGEHASSFYEKYADSDAYGPFIDGNRYVVERSRERTSVRSVLEEQLFSIALGVDIEDALNENYEIMIGPRTATLAEEFGTEFARYFDPKP